MDQQNQNQKQAKNSFFNIDSKIQFILKNIECLKSDYKSKFCKHDDACSHNIIKLTIKSFLMGYSVTALIDVIALLMKFKKLKTNPFILFYTLISKKNVRFASFPALYTLVMKSLICLSRKYLNIDNGQIWFLSGFIGGLVSLSVRERQNRSMWALFLLTRALETLYRYQIIKKYIPKIKLDYVFVYCLMIGFTVSIYFTEPSCNSRGLHKAWETFSCEDAADYGIRYIYQEKENRKLALIGLDRIDPNKYINWNRKF